MGLIDDIRADIIDITTDVDVGYAIEITLTALSPGNQIAVIAGLHPKHHLGIDPETGKQVNTKSSYVSFAEKQLTDLLYPVRNLNGEVALRGHKVTCKDSTGNEFTGIIRENFPDETLGYIVCLLGDFV